MQKSLIVILFTLLFSACTTQNVKTTPVTKAEPQECKPCSSQVTPPVTEPNKSTAQYGLLKPANWDALDGFLQDDLTASWNAWLTSCTTLKNKKPWQVACNAANKLKNPNNAQLVDYYTTYFDVYGTTKQNGHDVGLITGYYEPILKGSKTPSAKYQYPLYRQPKDLITVDLDEIHPELQFKRLIGKIDGDRLVPYLTRAQIETQPSPLAGNELVWVDDALDAFFVQIQGSGLVQLENGKQIHIGYASQNGHPYQSIGKALVARGELTLDQASIKSIKEWVSAHPDQLHALLNVNPSYVFFRELPDNLFGPLGSLGVPLTAERSVAIDPKFIPLGAPVFLSTTYPNSTQTLKRLMMAQDTGGAIKDGVRADFYWGSGEQAGKMAGAMKQDGNIWVLLPKEFKLSNQ
ncbi:MAG: MltA domain-containing protein [Methylophilus sp.]